MSAGQELLGWIGGTIGASISLPQMLRSARLGVDGVSATTWALMAGVTGGWAIWGVVEGNAPLIVTNSVACIAATVLVIYLATHGKRPSSVALMFPVALFAVNLVYRTGSIPVWAAGGMNVLSPIAIRAPQFLQLRHGSLTGVSAVTWALSCGSQLCWMLSAFRRDPWLLGANAGLLVTNIGLVVAIKSRRQERPRRYNGNP